MTKIKTKLVDATIRDKDGNIIGGKENFEVPEFWSERAAKIVASKYATNEETSVLQIIDRVVEQIADWGLNCGYFYQENPEDLKEYNDFVFDLKDILVNQRGTFNTPVWLNIGVKNNSKQSSACFLATIEDTMEDISMHHIRAARIFKSGSGVGFNVSKLRAKGESLSNKGSSSGPISFMRAWDRTASVVKSGGKSRRAAVLVAMNADHPDVEEFIQCKSNEEKKAQALIQSGISIEESYSTVDFQNANHSVVVSDEFMKAVIEDKDWNLINRGDKKVSKTLKAKDLFNKIANQAWHTGDPGLQFLDAMNKMNPLQVTGIIENSNPCAEVYLPPWGCCQLFCFNLPRYLDNENKINYPLLNADCKIIVTAMDILIGNADYPTEEFKKEAIETRPLGIGATDLAGYLIKKGLAYNSKEGRDAAKEVVGLITLNCIYDSIRLAEQLGPFKRYGIEKDSTYKVYDQVAYKANECNKMQSDIYFLLEDLKKYGIRNCTVTALAPNGTTGFMVDSDGTGIEPLFALEQTKQLSGGGTLTIIPKCVEEYNNKYPNFKSPLYVMGQKDPVDFIRGKRREGYNPEVLKTANEISWEDHILMTAALQSVISMGISKTINMPSEATIEDIKKAYMLAWETGCKGITIYRDGSKGMQPLTDANKKQEPKPFIEKVVSPVRTKMPSTRKSLTHKIEISGLDCYITVGLFEDGRPGELFIRASKQGSAVLGLLDSFATMVSLGLQYGVPLEKLIDKFKGQQFQPNGMTSNPEIRLCTSIIDYVFKWIDREFNSPEKIEEIKEKIEEKVLTIKSNSLTGDICTECGGLMQAIGSCKYCTVCATSTGCS